MDDDFLYQRRRPPHGRCHRCGIPRFESSFIRTIGDDQGDHAYLSFPIGIVSDRRGWINGVDTRPWNLRLRSRRLPAVSRSVIRSERVGGGIRRGEGSDADLDEKSVFVAEAAEAVRVSTEQTHGLPTRARNQRARLAIWSSEGGEKVTSEFSGR